MARLKTEKLAEHVQQGGEDLAVLGGHANPDRDACGEQQIGRGGPGIAPEAFALRAGGIHGGALLSHLTSGAVGRDELMGNDDTAGDDVTSDQHPQLAQASEPDSTADDPAQAWADLDLQDIRVARTLHSVLPELRAMAESSDRVGHAARCTLVAACERLTRLLQRDVPAERA